MRILWPLLCLILVACGETRAQKQQLAQACSDLIAAKAQQPAPDLGKLIAAALDRIEAFAAGTGMDLPAPITPAEHLTTPSAIQSEFDAAAQARRDPPRGGWSSVWLWLTATGAVAFAVARQIAPKLGPLGGLWSKAADGAWRLLAHRGQRTDDLLAQRALAAAPILIIWAQTVCQDDTLSAMIPPEQVQTLIDLAAWNPQRDPYPGTVPT
jgi:hypothetical protein